MAAIHMNAQTFHQQILESNRPVLIEFWAPWCSYCRRLTPALAKIEETYSDTLIFGKVNIDEEPQLAELEQIEVIPTLVLYHSGKALGSIVAPESKAGIEAFLKETISI